jgi:hypothetical protein
VLAALVVHTQTANCAVCPALIDELANGWTLTHSCGVAALCVLLGDGLGDGLGLVVLLGEGLGLVDGFLVPVDDGFGLGSVVLLLGLGLAELVLGPADGLELDGEDVGLLLDPLGDGLDDVLEGEALPDVPDECGDELGVEEAEVVVVCASSAAFFGTEEHTVGAIGPSAEVVDANA